MSENKNKQKLCFVDTETTGVDPLENDIFQISAIITDSELNELERINLKFTPFSMDNVQEAAMEVTGESIESLNQLEMSSKEAYDQFIAVLEKYCDRYDKLDKLQLVAYNATFDSEFLRQFFTKNGDKYFGSWFWYPALCVMQSAAWLVKDSRRSFQNFKLGTLCECAGLDWDEDAGHDAMYDIEQTLNLYKYLTEETQN